MWAGDGGGSRSLSSNSRSSRSSIGSSRSSSSKSAANTWNAASACRKQPTITYGDYVAKQFATELEKRFSSRSGGGWLRLFKKVSWAARVIAKERPGSSRAAAASILMASISGAALAAYAAMLIVSGSTNPYSSDAAQDDLWNPVQERQELLVSDSVSHQAVGAWVVIAVTSMIGLVVSAGVAAFGSFVVLAPPSFWTNLRSKEELGAELVERSRSHEPEDHSGGLLGKKPFNLNAMDEDWTTADEAPPDKTPPKPVRRRARGSFAAAALRGKAGYRGRLAVTEVQKAALVWTASLAKGVTLPVDGQQRELLVKRPFGSVPFRRNRGSEAEDDGSNGEDAFDGTYASYTNLCIGPCLLGGNAPAVDGEPAAEPPAAASAAPIILPLVGLGLRLKNRRLHVVHNGGGGDGGSKHEQTLLIELESDIEALELALALRLLRAESDSGAGVLDWGERPADNLKRPPPAE